MSDRHGDARQGKQHGVTVRERAGATTIAWSGWEATNFFAWVALLVLPGWALLSLGAWIKLGRPATLPTPFHQLPLPVFVLACALAAWNTLALVLNRRNRLRVTNASVEVRQGVVPWLVCYRRASYPRGAVGAIDLDTVMLGEDNAEFYAVRAKIGGSRVRLTGAMVPEARAQRIADALRGAIEGGGASP